MVGNISTLEVGRPTGSIETPQVPAKCVRTDFGGAPKKKNRKRSVPIGENVRDAIKSIKGTGIDLKDRLAWSVDAGSRKP